MISEISMKQYEYARQTRDPRFDGRFYIGVKTTGIYCRPICPVKLPRAINVTFFTSAAAASEAGYRPCLRCRPESSPGTPAWMGTSTTVNRALRLIGEGALDDGSVEEMCERLGITARHLSRLFAQHLGATPKSVAQTRRLQFAKKLLDETNLSMTEVALSSGYKSVRRFNDHLKQTYGKTPSKLRASRRSKPSLSPRIASSGRCRLVDLEGTGSREQDLNCFQLKLSYRPPIDFSGLLSFLQRRGIPGVETVDDQSYSRTIRIGPDVGRVRLTHDENASALIARIEINEPRHLIRITEKLKRMFDLSADPASINKVLALDKGLAKLIEKNPGQRLPGSWDPFEIAVRAIVGQQVSVKGATTVMGRIAASYGIETSVGLCFPGPEALAELDTSQLSMPRARAQAIKEMSRCVAEQRISFDAGTPNQVLVEALKKIKGIGEWTADYIAMRALNDPDAFLHGDLVLLKVVEQQFGIQSGKALLARAESWRPWRAYAGMHLWRLASTLDKP